MGYGSYKLASGKEAGYYVEATCEHPGCSAKIDRGMSFVCAGEPGDQGGWSCEGYFCNDHLYSVGCLPDSDAIIELREYVSTCAQCTSLLAFMDQIEEAEQYRADPKFSPNADTLDVLTAEGCVHLPSPTKAGGRVMMEPSNIERAELPQASAAYMQALEERVDVLEEALRPFANVLSVYSFAEHQLILLSEDNPKGRRLAHLLPDHFEIARDLAPTGEDG